MLGLIWAIKRLRPYLEGYKFTAITDHSSLKWLNNLKEPSGRLARWALELQQWDFDILYRKGSLNYVPDALSRISYHELRREKENEEDDFDYLAALDEITDKWCLRRIKEIQAWPWKFPDWQLVDNRMYVHRRDYLLDPIDGEENNWKLVLPRDWIRRAFQEVHHEPYSGHFGITKTYDRLARTYFWPGMYHDTLQYVSSCLECQRHKSVQTGPQGLMGKKIVESPWTVVAADCMEFPTSKNGFKYLLVFQDLFTKMIELKPIRK